MIETARLQLAPLTESDWPLFLQLHQLPEVTKLCFDPPSELEVRAKFTERLIPWQPDSETPLCLTIRDKQSGELLGVTGFTCSLRTQAEVGYLLLPVSHGKGYATECLQAVIDWAWQQHGIANYTAVVTEGKIGSMRVLEKCGFKTGPVVPDAYQIGGKSYADHHFTLSLGERR